MNLYMKQKQSQRHRKQTCGCQGGGEVGEGRYRLLYIGWIKSKVLLYSTGNCIQYPVINHNGIEYEKEYITESLCYTSEANTL